MFRIDPLAICTALCLVMLGVHPPAIAADITADGRLLDRVVALVDEEVITRSELDERLREVRTQIASRGTAMPPNEMLERQVLENLVVERLQIQEARRLGIRVDDFTLSDAMERIAASNQLTLEEFRDRLVADGVDFARFREQVRNEIAIDQLRRRQVDSRIQVTDQEVDDLIASERGTISRGVEYHIAHILVAVPEGATTEIVRSVRERAETLRARALAGEDFATLALSESDGQQALEGGDLGWRNMAQIPTVLARAVSLLEPGGVSEPLRSPSGFHLVKLIDRRGGDRSFVTQTHARHILMKPSALLADEEVEARLESLRTRILAGEDFAELARANSEDKGSAMRGGDLGWADPGSFVPDFEAMVDRLEEGEVSAPFPTPFGWHIVQVLDRREHDSTREVLRSRAREFIRERKREEEYDLWLRRLRGEAFVEYRL